MISNREAELLARRAALRERIAQQRQQLALAVRPLQTACARVDHLRSALSKAVAVAQDWAARHPFLLIAAGAAVVAARPRRVLRWGGRAFALWRAARRLRQWLPPWAAAGRE